MAARQNGMDCVLLRYAENKIVSYYPPRRNVLQGLKITVQRGMATAVQ